MGSDISMINKVKIWLSRTVLIKYLEDATYILRIHVYKDRTNGIIGLSHKLYIEKLLKRFSMGN